MYNVAVVGATGAVGRELMKVLDDLKFPVKKLLPLASERSAGTEMETPFGVVKVEKLAADKFEGIDVAFFCAGATISKEYAHEAVKRGALVIDNSSAFRMDPNVPLVVPEVNIDAARNHKGIIANPNCSTIIMLVPLAPIHKRYTIKRIIVSTYQAVSGAGHYGMEALENETKAYIEGKEIVPDTLPVRSGAVHHQIAFNVIPQVDVAMEDGYTKEEHKMIFETRKIFANDAIGVCATTVRVPVFRSHSESITVETLKPVPLQELREVLSHSPGVVLQDDIKNSVYPMPYYASGTDEVYVGRLREDPSAPNSICMWVVGDQLRKGAATTAVQIAQKLFE